MMSIRRLVVVAALVVGATGLATPAHAAVGDLPETDGLFTLNCANTDPDVQVYSIDPTTAAMTRVGSGYQANTNACAMGVVRDPTTGTFYSIAWIDTDTSDPGLDYGLVTVDPDTGAITLVSGISLDGNTEWSGPYQLCFDGDGQMYGITGAHIWSMDKGTGVATPLTDFTNPISGVGGCKYNPLDGNIYVSEFGGSGLYTLDIDTLTFTSAGTLPVSNGQMFDFDSDGNLWLQDWNNLLTGSLDDLAHMTTVGEMRLDGSTHTAQALFINKPWSPPSDDDTQSSEPLAETGFDTLPVLVAAIVAIAGGIALARRRRRV